MELLPVGSVVILKNAVKPILIYGRKQTNIETGIEYDYLACLYPEGFVSQEYTYLFNHNTIGTILFTGYIDDSEKKLLDRLKAYYIGKEQQRD